MVRGSGVGESVAHDSAPAYRVRVLSTRRDAGQETLALVPSGSVFCATASRVGENTR